MRFRMILVAGLALTLFAQVAWADQIVPTRYKGVRNIDEAQPAASENFFAWSQNSADHVNQYNSWFEPVDQSAPATKINARGTRSLMGTLNGDEGMFQEIKSGAHTSHSNVYFYDVATATRTAPPSGVNTAAWEWSPASSPGYILFGRSKFRRPSSPWKVILYDRTNTTFTTLDSATNKCACVFPGTVTDSYAVWTNCSSGTCQVFSYDIANGITHKVPNPLGRQQYAASISTDAESIYYARSGTACGKSVRLMRFDIGTPTPVIVSSLPVGVDIAGNTFAFTDDSGHDHVYFAEFDCSDGATDIYVTDGAETATSASGATARGAAGAKSLRPLGARP